MWNHIFKSKNATIVPHIPSALGPLIKQPASNPVESSNFVIFCQSRQNPSKGINKKVLCHFKYHSFTHFFGYFYNKSLYKLYASFIIKVLLRCYFRSFLQLSPLSSLWMLSIFGSTGTFVTFVMNLESLKNTHIRTSGPSTQCVCRGSLCEHLAKLKRQVYLLS